MEEELKKKTCNELKKFLKERGKKCSGDKKALLRLALIYADEPIQPEGEEEVLAADVHALEQKRQVFSENVTWQKLEKGQLPQVPRRYTIKKIYAFLGALSVITDVTSGEKVVTDCSTDKPAVKGRQMYRSRKIRLMKHAQFENKSLFRADIQASFKKECRTAFACIDSNGTIEITQCDCVQRSDGKCAHVAVLLLAIEDVSINLFPLMSETEEVACTSTGQKWGKGKTKGHNPKPVHMCQYSKKRRLDRLILFDPRPEGYRETTDEEINAFLTDLKYRGPSMWANVPFKHSDYDLSQNREEILLTLRETFLQSMSHQLEPYTSDPRSNEHCVHVTNSDAQTESEVWWMLRSRRITASKFKDFFNGPQNETNQILWKPPKDLSKVSSVI